MERILIDIQKFASGSISMSTDGAMTGFMSWNSVVQGNTAAEKASLNKSKVGVDIYVKRTSSWTQGNFTGSTTINGVSQSFDINKYIQTDWVLLSHQEIEVSHNVDGSKTITISGVIHGPSGTTLEGKTSSGSQVVTLDTIPRYFSQTPKVEFQSNTTTSATFKWTTSEYASAVKYILDSGTETSCFSGNALTGAFTINNLSSNTSHTLKIKAQRKDSGLWSDGNTINFSTSNKTARVRVNGVWKDATPYVRINGQWKVATMYTRDNGQWKRGR